MNQMPLPNLDWHQTCYETSPLHRSVLGIHAFTQRTFDAAHQTSCRMLKLDVLLKN